MTERNSSVVSSIDNLPSRKSGPWIRRKYFFLERYMHIFTHGMDKKWEGELSFVDLFAGPGRCYIAKEEVEIDGSALMSLEFPFRRYFFVEMEAANLEALKLRCERSPKLNSIRFVPGDCNKVLNQIDPTGLTLAFIDPTGIDIHFHTIKSLAEGRKVDLLMTIMDGMDIRRNFDRYLKNPEGGPLDHFLGGNVGWAKIKSPRDVVEEFRNRLRGIGYKTVEFTDIPVSNERHAPMYFLLFASRHPRGLDFWKKITATDDSGQMEFGLGEVRDV